MARSLAAYCDGGHMNGALDRANNNCRLGLTIFDSVAI